MTLIRSLRRPLPFDLGAWRMDDAGGFFSEKRLETSQCGLNFAIHGSAHFRQALPAPELWRLHRKHPSTPLVEDTT